MENTAGEWVQAGPGVRRRILGHVPEMMMVEVAFQAGSVGPPHSHPHIQSSYVSEGRFEVTIDGVTRIVTAGEAFVVASNMTHGVVALEAGRL
ncbi:MAG: cupin domain-containing protein, partial [Acetobacteraceae bacterium]